jgi:hypothetical protein
MSSRTSRIIHLGIFCARCGPVAMENSANASRYLPAASRCRYLGTHVIEIRPSTDTPGS